MSVPNSTIVKEKITSIIQELSTRMSLNSEVNGDTCPNDIGISSQVLLSVTNTLESVLEVEIPANCHLFYDKTNKKKLSILEASEKLIKVIYHGRKKV